MTLARTGRRTEDCEPVGGIGDADKTGTPAHREVSCKQNWRVSSTQSHSLEKAAVAPACEPVSVDDTGAERDLSELA